MKMENKGGNKINKNMLFWIGMFLILIWIFRLDSFSAANLPKDLSYGEFYRLLQNNKQSLAIKSVIKMEDELKGVLSSGAHFNVRIPQEDPELLNLLRNNVPDFDIKPPKTLWANLFYSLGPMLLFIGFCNNLIKELNKHKKCRSSN